MNKEKLIIRCSRYKIVVILLAAYCSLIPLENVLSASYGGSINKYIGFAIMAVICLSILQKRRIGLNTHIPYSFYAFFAIVLISNIYIFDEGGWNSGKIVLSMVFFLVIILQYHINTREYELISISMILVAVVLSIMVAFGTGMSVVVVGRASLSIGGQIIDQNNLAVSIAIPCIIVFDKIWTSDKRLRLVSVLAFIVMIYAILLTGSRGGLMAFIAAIIVYIMVIQRKNKWQSIAVMLLFAILFSFFLEKYLPSSLLSRFTIQDVAKNGGSGRTEIWMNALRIFESSPTNRKLFGYGFGTFPYVYSRYCYRFSAAHNDFVQVIIELGVVGLFSFLFMWWAFFKKVMSKSNALAVALLVCVFVASFSMEMLVKKMLWNAWYISISLIQISDKDCVKPKMCQLK